MSAMGRVYIPHTIQMMLQKYKKYGIQPKNKITSAKLEVVLMLTMYAITTFNLRKLYDNLWQFIC